MLATELVVVDTVVDSGTTFDLVTVVLAGVAAVDAVVGTTPESTAVLLAAGVTRSDFIGLAATVEVTVLVLVGVLNKGVLNFVELVKLGATIALETVTGLATVVPVLVAVAIAVPTLVELSVVASALTV